MKKGIFILLQLLLTVTVFAQTYKYTSTNLNMRSGPGTSYEKLAIIPKGTSIEMAEDCDCAWIKVSYKGIIGYVSSKYLSDKQPVNYLKSDTRTYESGTNSTSHRVKSSKHTDSAPDGATALCRDGTYSYSVSRRGTCSHHGGVARWLR